MTHQTRLPCGRPLPDTTPLRLCKKTAIIFGKFAGGMCIDHAIAMDAIDPSFIDQLHPESRVALKTALGSSHSQID